MSLAYDSAVIGLGRTGASCVRHLLAAKERLLAVDSRQTPPCLEAVRQMDQSNLTIQTGGFHEETISYAGRLVFSPGVDRRAEPFRSSALSHIPVTGDIQLFADALARRKETSTLVAVTGSNGKSTIVDLIGLVLGKTMRVVVGGNFDTPALDLLAQTDVACRVLEMSSFQLELVQHLNANIAVLADISADHLDRYGSFADYATCKKRIFRHAGLCIWNRSQPMTQPAADVTGRMLSVGLQPPDNDTDFGLVMADSCQYLAHAGWRFPVASLGLRGEHNYLNMLCALAVAQAMGVELDDAIEALRGYRGLAHRLQTLGTAGGISFVDDSKATNEAAAVAALQSLKTPEARNVLLLAGGLGKRKQFRQLADAAKDCVRHAVFFGEAAHDLQASFGNYLDCECVGHLQAAFEKLIAKARSGDVVLLSPACASHDQFEDFRARGLFFQSLVKDQTGLCEGCPDE